MKKISYFLCFGTGFLLCIQMHVQAAEVSLQNFKAKNYVVFQPSDLSQLHLALNDHTGQVLGSFKAWQKLLTACQPLKFGMNAGMYHPNYQPVGLYIENSKQQVALNTQQGVGNFFMQPNGVLAWNKDHAIITTTSAWQAQSFNASYATQSGPMLVVNHQIMQNFIPESDSKKIRNGVGIKNGQLYFVMSQERVNFYEFAEFFKEKLSVKQALYLDGSISSIYAPTLKRYDRAFKLGPMLGYFAHQPNC